MATNYHNRLESFYPAEMVSSIGLTGAGALAEFGLHNPDMALGLAAGAFAPLLLDSLVWRMDRSKSELPFTKGLFWLAAATVPTAVLALTGHHDYAAWTALGTVGVGLSFRANRHDWSKQRTSATR